MVAYNITHILTKLHNCLKHIYIKANSGQHTNRIVRACVRIVMRAFTNVDIEMKGCACCKAPFNRKKQITSKWTKLYVYHV